MTTSTPRLARPRAALALTLAIGCGAAVAGGPANDNWAAREVIPALPYPTDLTGSIASATLEPSDPAFFCRLGTIGSGAAPAAKTIWYGYQTGPQTEYVNIASSGYDTLLAVYSGDPVLGFVQVAGGCSDNGGSGGGSRLNGLRLEPSTSYSIVIAAFDAATPATLAQFDMASARVYAVTKTADTRDGACDADCSLREAIDAANADPGAVVVPAGNYGLTRTGENEDANATGDLDVRQGMGIYGADASTTVLDGSAADRVVHVDPSGAGAYSVALADLSLANGIASSDGGGLANAATALAGADFVQLSQLVLVDNRTSQSGGGARLGGISWLLDVTVNANVALLDGGGLVLRPPVPAAEVRSRIERSTISANRSERTSTGGGGGLLSALDVTIASSTLSGNTAFSNGGGALAEARTLTLADATVTLNRARANGGGAPDGGGVAHAVGGPLVVRNSILAGNRAGSGSGTLRDCFITGASTLVTSSDTLVQAPGGCLFTHPNDVSGVDPQLLPLADNAGATRTHGLAETSPAIDTGAACLASDQRGVKRPRDGDGDSVPECDRGAVEQITELLLRNGFEGP